MIRGILILAFSIFLNAYASAQLFQAPTRLTFANVNVKLDAGAQQIVQTDVYALLSNRTTLNTRLDRASLYFPIIENILSEEKVPNDFKYLVLQESGLAPDAVSTSNAVGFWQFKKETATDYGLRVDDEIDERKNIHASTRAAANYLKKNNTTLNNWISTLYSYYLGLGGIRSLVPSEWNGANEITLTDKTDRYILRCMAHKLVYENELRGYRTSQTPFYEYKASGGKTFTQIADQLGVDEVELRRYNRWVGGSKVPQDRAYTMLVVVDNTTPAQQAVASNQSAPVTTASQTSASANRNATALATRKAKAKEPDFPVLKRITATSKRSTSGPIYYQINGKDGILAQDGDTYESISKRADIRPGRFLSINDMEESDKIEGGKVYYIQKKAKNAAVEFHTLQHGETAWDVSQMYGIRLGFLLRKNRIASATEPLQPGRVLWLKKRRPCKTAIEVVPLPEPERPKEEEKPLVADVPDNTNSGTDVAVTVPSTTTPTPTKGTSSRVVLVDENGQVVSGNPSESRPSQPVTTQPVKTAPAKTQPEVASRPATNPSRYPVTPGEDETSSRSTRQPAASTTRPEGTTYHTVESGETFYAIARKYNLKPDELLELNGLKSYPLLKKGESLLVKGTPLSKPAPVQETVSAPVREVASAAGNTPNYHIVKTGETFFSIARKYNITPEELRDINKLKEFPRVNVGDRFLLHSGAGRPNTSASSSIPASTNEGEWRYHTVQNGETMYGISRQYNVKVNQIRTWNNMLETDLIRTGMRLKIKNK